MDNSAIVYLLDDKNRIVSVSGPWDEFADENDGVNVHAADVTGRSIWSFILGDVTRMWLNTAFQFARVQAESIERDYRCDSPDLKRYMRMRIVPNGTGILRIEHETLATEEREAPVHIRSGSANSIYKIRSRCSFCGCIKDGEEWEEPLPEHAEEESGRIIVMYTVCDECQRLMPGASTP